MKTNQRYFLTITLIATLFSTQGFSWGWEAHKYIHEHAVEYLPPEMAFFKDHQVFLAEHAPDPDKTKNRPGYWHFIDIDNYPEYFAGTMPSELPKLLDLYDWKTVSGNGIVPWAIGYEMDSLMTLMADGNWDMAWQAAADLGHYVADSHQPLHLTANYNGQLTGQKGIHSRYETKMINPYLKGLNLPAGHAVYLENVNEVVFQYIHELYPQMNQILAADSIATKIDPAQDSTYYATMWSALDSMTIDALNRSILDLASIWYTTWVNAGCPYPPGVNSTEAVADDLTLKIKKTACLFMRPTVKVTYFLPADDAVSIGVYDTHGQLVRQLVNENDMAGVHTMRWKMGPQLVNSVHFIRLSSRSAELAVKLDGSR